MSDAAKTIGERLKQLQEQHEQAVNQYNGLMRAAEEVKNRIIEIKGAKREIAEILKQLGQAESPAAPEPSGHLKAVELVKE